MEDVDEVIAKNRHCRRCGVKDSAVIAPCQCSGELRYIHRACLTEQRVRVSTPSNKPPSDVLSRFMGRTMAFTTVRDVTSPISCRLQGHRGSHSDHQHYVPCHGPVMPHGHRACYMVIVSSCPIRSARHSARTGPRRKVFRLDCYC